MVKKKLVEELIADGPKLLRELDRQSFPVDSMFWVHLPEVDYWRLVIATPMVGQRGAAAGYRLLNGVLRDVDLAGITLEDISLVDPESGEFRSFQTLVSASSRLASGPEWIEFEDAIVYRWTISGELDCEVSSAELNKLWEAEQKRSNLPALLIRSENRRVMLRFHPQHGTLWGIENVKKAFLIALHRPDARPDCGVLKWFN